MRMLWRIHQTVTASTAPAMIATYCTEYVMLAMPARPSTMRANQRPTSTIQKKIPIALCTS